MESEAPGQLIKPPAARTACLRARLRERERIARVLHDTFLQSVQALMTQFQLVRQQLPPGHPVQARIARALSYAEEVLDEGREQVLGLRMHRAPGGGLESALSRLGDMLAARHGARFVMRVLGQPRRLRGASAGEAYAIGREALSNAFRHAHGDEVALELEHADRSFTLRVRDRGRGIDPDTAARGHRPGRYGLTGMRERARDLGATLAIHGAADEGTTVTLRIPAGRAYARRNRTPGAARFVAR